jgi:hypothetical protein
MRYLPFGIEVIQVAPGLLRSREMIEPRQLSVT